MPIADAGLLDFAAADKLGAGPCTAGADCEREIEIQDLQTQISVRLDPCGARVIDVNPALAAGAFVTARYRQAQANQAGA